MGNKRRICVIDTIRGIMIIGMVVYHLIFDLTDIFKLNIRWIYSPLADFIRDFGAGTFIFLAGISSRLSHNNYIRALKTLICALILSIVTYFYMPDEFIFMGVLHFMGVMMLMYALFGRFLEKINPKALFIVNIILFALCTPLLRDKAPKCLKINNLTFVLGFGGGDWYSADYFPIFPWMFLFVAGTALGYYVKNRVLPEFLYRDYCKPVTFAGRNTIFIYMLHQPIIYGILTLIFKFR